MYRRRLFLCEGHRPPLRTPCGIPAQSTPAVSGIPRCGLHTIFVHFEAFVQASIILYCSPPTCIANTIVIALHDYWAIYDPPSTSLVCAIHHTILVITISCKGQPSMGWRGTGPQTVSPEPTRGPSWPVQEIVLFRGFCARIYPILCTAPLSTPG